MRTLVPLFLLLAGMASGAFAQQVTTVISAHPDLRDYLVFHPSGTLYVSNQQDKISRVELGLVTPYVTGLTFVTGLVFAADGTLYASDSGTGEILKITSQRDISVFVSGLDGDGSIGPVGLVFDQAGNLYVSVYDGTIRKITPNGSMSTLAEGGDLTKPAGLAIDEAGNLYAANFFSGKIVKCTPAGETSLLATLPSWLGYMTYAGGALYATGYNTHVIYRITLEGQFSVFAGSGAQGQTDEEGVLATFTTPNGITVDPAGTSLYVTSDTSPGSLRIIEGISEVTATEGLPEFPGYTLGKNHPNPFRRTTTLSFTLPAPDAVTLTLHDVLGRTLRVPVRGFYPSGSHSLTINMDALPAGPYLYTLRTERGFVKTGSMLHVGL